MNPSHWQQLTSLGMPPVRQTATAEITLRLVGLDQVPTRMGWVYMAQSALYLVQPAHYLTCIGSRHRFYGTAAKRVLRISVPRLQPRTCCRYSQCVIQDAKSSHGQRCPDCDNQSQPVSLEDHHDGVHGWRVRLRSSSPKYVNTIFVRGVSMDRQAWCKPVCNHPCRH